MNRVPLVRRTQIINALVEGNSIRSTERMTEAPCGDGAMVWRLSVVDALA